MKPLGKKIKIAIEEAKIGAIQTDSIEEVGTILAVGTEVHIAKSPIINLNDNKITYQAYVAEELIGKKLYFKAWAVDVITVGDTKHYFIDADSDGLCAIEF